MIASLSCESSNDLQFSTDKNLPGKELPGGPRWLRLHLPMQVVWVWSVVGEISSHTLHGQKNQNTKQKKYCNKYNKDFKNGPHQKKKIFL